MKIVITGAHRVGKTTLAEKLQESLADYDILQEPYYELEELGYVFSEIPNTDDFIAQLEHSIKQIAINEDNVIFDRCPIDFLAYIQAIDGSRSIQSIFNKVESIMSNVDLLVFVPIEKPDLITCGELDFPELRYQVNEILNDWIWDFGIETLEVRGNLLSRIDQVLRKIS
jgi:GTPase SAR1 family protein